MNFIFVQRRRKRRQACHTAAMSPTSSPVSPLEAQALYRLETVALPSSRPGGAQDQDHDHHQKHTSTSSADTDCSVPTTNTDDSLKLEDAFSPLGPTMTWFDQTPSHWSDAATASTVLSLLHKEPLRSPPPSLPESDTNTKYQPHHTCSICFESRAEACYPRSPIASGCDHTSIPDIYVCTSCLRRSLDLQLSSTSDGLLACPLCHAQLSDNEVQRWASTKTFQEYSRLRTWQILEEDAEFVTCIRRDCGYGQFHAGGLEDPIVVCGSCGTRTCYIHRGTAWHEGLSCAEYEELGKSPVDDYDTRNFYWTAGP
ncbi:hypothetical protein P168DRAFT_38586 [Aspergillus campestris IBT 28561]|uniref:RING-type domain-containing protein n=1 Tax=Aspergillus campestris (strain IBT 28561) TaxID=1392248 RepID=A0A2I1CWF4_ASPC2|nr:uncharacterized protein P168DRAFT_38586 [Aspergillus campestris IBT 28561]PKY01951.1 hypothetical protein P168DRAFT_38586 [Aspergillus campestris IBT 28561]